MKEFPPKHITDFSTYSAEEVEEFLKAITVRYQGSQLPGSKVYHGTILGEVNSVRFGPKNIGKGFGGVGLYIDFLEDVAARYASIKDQFHREGKIIMEGHLNPHKQYRVARIQIANRFVPKSNLKKGIFHPDWMRDQSLQNCMLKEFDILEIFVDSNQYATYTDHFLVIHERADVDVIEWTQLKKRVVLNSKIEYQPIPFPEINSQPIHTNEKLNGQSLTEIENAPRAPEVTKGARALENIKPKPIVDPFLPPNNFVLPADFYEIGSMLAAKNLHPVEQWFGVKPADYTNNADEVFEYARQLLREKNVQQFWNNRNVTVTSPQELTASQKVYQKFFTPDPNLPKELTLLQKIGKFGKGAMGVANTIIPTACLFLNISDAYAADINRDIDRAIVLGSAITVFQIGIYTGIAFICPPAALALGGASMASHYVPPMSESELKKILTHVSSVPGCGDFTTQDALTMGWVIDQSARTVEDKLREWATKVADSKGGQKVAQFIGALANVMKRIPDSEFAIDLGPAFLPPKQPQAESKKQSKVNSNENSKQTINSKAENSNILQPPPIGMENLNPATSYQTQSGIYQNRARQDLLGNTKNFQNDITGQNNINSNQVQPSNNNELMESNGLGSFSKAPVVNKNNSTPANSNSKTPVPNKFIYPQNKFNCLPPKNVSKLVFDNATPLYKFLTNPDRGVNVHVDAKWDKEKGLVGYLALGFKINPITITIGVGVFIATEAIDMWKRRNAHIANDYLYEINFDLETITDVEKVLNSQLQEINDFSKKGNLSLADIIKRNSLLEKTIQNIDALLKLCSQLYKLTNRSHRKDSKVEQGEKAYKKVQSLHHQLTPTDKNEDPESLPHQYRCFKRKITSSIC